MPPFNLNPTYFSEEETRETASRQVLPFLSLGGRPGPTQPLSRRAVDPAPSKRLFSLDAFDEDSFAAERPLFKWKTRPVYDVDDRLLFYDHTAPLSVGNEVHVRTAASDLLRTPVWSVRTGRTINLDGLINKAVSVIKNTADLEPVFVGNEITPRLICYSYPRLGIMCFARTRPGLRFVIDLWDLEFREVGVPEIPLPSESARTIWSPYDFVTPVTFGHVKSLWTRNETFLRNLPDVPPRRDDLREAVFAAGTVIQETLTIRPEIQLEGQQTTFFCAAATARMILRHYAIILTQDQIAIAMNTTAQDGATPENQERAIAGLTELRLAASLDKSASFQEAQEEIRQNRPFKTGGVSHARVCSGYVIEGNGKEWLYINDPLPANSGSLYYEAWEAGLHSNYMYIRPTLYY